MQLLASELVETLELRWGSKAGRMFSGCALICHLIDAEPYLGLPDGVGAAAPPRFRGEPQGEMTPRFLDRLGA